MDVCRAIHTAILNGDSSCLIRLLSKDSAYCHIRNQFGWTPLHTAAYALQEKAARILLRAGADSEATDSQGNSPLQLALQIDSNSAVVRVLSGKPDYTDDRENPPTQGPGWRRFGSWLRELLSPSSKGSDSWVPIRRSTSVC